MEGDPTPGEAPTSRLVIAQEDLDRISAAIRDGLEKEPPPPDGRKLLWDALKVLGAFSLLVIVYFVLTHWRPAVDISVRANALSMPQVLAHDPEEGHVDWRVGTGQVRALTVDELRAEELEADQFMISLPIPRTDCDEVAASLDATCDDGVIELQAPLTVAWDDPQVLQLERAATADQVPSRSEPVPHELKLTLQHPSANPAGMTGEATDEAAEESETGSAAPQLPQLTIADWQAARQQWCFTYQTAGGATTLSISGGSDGYERTFEPASAPDVGCDALQLRVTAGAATTPDGSQGPSATANADAATGRAPDETRRASSRVTLSGISSLDVTTESRHLSASALTGSLTLLQDIRVFESATQADFAAGEPLISDLDIQTGTSSLTIDGHGVTSIETARGNLISTVWQRNSELMLPIFIGVVGVFTPLLGTVYRNGVDYLANRRSRPTQ